MLSVGSAVQPVAQPGAAPDSIPTTPNKRSTGCEVVGVLPELKVEPLPVAEEITSLPERPENSSTLTRYLPDNGKLTLIDAPDPSARTLRADSMIVRPRPSPSERLMSM